MKQLQAILKNLDRNFGQGKFILLGCALILLTRLPQFLGNMFFPDGDECIIGLMAQHILDGKGFPLFFYGHAKPYALAIFETLPAALLFKLFGFSAVSLKAAILCLWTVGWIFFVFALWRFGNRRMAMVGGLLLLFSPGWGAMSLKAWGTHVTAFTAMNLSLWILADIYRRTEDCRNTVLLLGCSLAVVILANPIWCFALFPFIALLLYKRRKISDIVFMAIGACCLAAIIFLARQASGGTVHYWGPQLFTDGNLLEALKLMPERVLVAMTGAYFLTSRLETGPATILATGIWILSSLLFLGCIAVRLVKKRSLDFFTTGFAGAIIAMLAFSLFINNKLFGYRYFLPLIGSFVALTAAGIDRLWIQGRLAKLSAQTLLALLIFTGMMSLMEFRNVPSSGLPMEPGAGEAEAMANLTDRLLSQNIRFVYSIDAMLQWQIMFASRERIKARWFDPADRYPEYPRAVDRALAFKQKVAVVGRLGQLKSLAAVLIREKQDFSRLEDIDGWYMIIYDPDLALLRRMGFVLNQ